MNGADKPAPVNNQGGPKLGHSNQGVLSGKGGGYLRVLGRVTEGEL